MARYRRILVGGVAVLCLGVLLGLLLHSFSSEGTAIDFNVPEEGKHIRFFGGAYRVHTPLGDDYVTSSGVYLFRGGVIRFRPGYSVRTVLVGGNFAAEEIGPGE